MAAALRGFSLSGPGKVGFRGRKAQVILFLLAVYRLTSLVALASRPSNSLIGSHDASAQPFVNLPSCRKIG